MASTRMSNSTAIRILSREAAGSPLAIVAGKEASLVRCRNYASTSKSVSHSIIGCNEKTVLVPNHMKSAMLARGLSSSAVAASPSTSQSTPPPSSSTSTSQVPPAAPAAKGLLGGIAKIMGYDTRTSAAIRTTSDYYDRCSERDEKEGTFWYDECGLPISYQSWMQITNLHIWLLSVRFRSLPAPLGRTYIQEIVNHYFIHAESLMRGRYNIKQNRLIKGYMRDMLYQYHGANMGYDEGLVSGSDAVLAAAVWRNLFGAGWGRMGGVKGKLNQDGKEIAADPKDPQSDNITPEEALADLDVATPPPPPSPLGATEAVAPQKVGNQAGGYHSGGSGLVDPLPKHEPPTLEGVEAKEARFAVDLERLVKWIRSEVRRMENISDEDVMNGAGIDRMSGKSNPGSLTDFSRI